MNRPRARDSQADAAWLASALQEQAHEHEPDLARINARVMRLTADEPHPVEPRRPRRPAWLRPIGVPLATAAVVAAVSLAAAVTFGISEGRTTHLSGHTAAPSSSRNSTSAGHRQSPHPASIPAHPTGTIPAPSHSSPPTSAGPLTATGTVDPHSTQYWAQETLTVTTTRPTRGLHVIVTVSGDSRVQPTGTWTTIASADINTTAKPTSSGLVYDIALKPGHTLQANVYTFGLQFNHPAGSHDFAADTFRVTAVIDGGGTAQVTASGTFSQ